MSKVKKKRQNFNSRLLSMEVKVGLPPFVGYKNVLVVFVCLSSAILIEVD